MASSSSIQRTTRPRDMGLAAYAPAIAGVEAKLERVMPDNLKRRVRAVRDTTRVVLPRGEPSLDDHALLTLTTAAEDSRRVAFRYHSPERDMMDRTIDPYGVVFRQGRWYVIGFCHLRQAMRSFRLDRIDQVRACTETFRRPADFDPATFLQDSLSSWGQDMKSLWYCTPIAGSCRPWGPLSRSVPASSRPMRTGC